MNKDAYRTKRNKLTYSKFCEQEQFYSGLYTIENDLNPSHISGTKVINHIGLHNISASNITKSRQLLHVMLFSGSDHRAIFVDINYKEEMKMTVEELPSRPGQCLVSKTNNGQQII